jgi:cell division protein FtsI/penicillin-binding protein 2
MISVEGVPGYAYIPLNPASSAALAMASSPSNNNFSIVFTYSGTNIEIFSVSVKSACRYFFFATLLVKL